MEEAKPTTSRDHGSALMRRARAGPNVVRIRRERYQTHLNQVWQNRHHQ